MYERSIAPDDRAVTDLVLSFLRSAFKHLSSMSPPSSAEALTQDTLDSMTSGLKNLLTAPLIVIATGHWGIELLRNEVQAPDRTGTSSASHSTRTEIPYSKWEHHVYERDREREGAPNSQVGVGRSLHQDRMTGGREYCVRSKPDERKKDRYDTNEGDRDGNIGTEKGSQSFDFVDCWKLLFGWWLDLTDRLEEQKRIDGPFSPTPSLAPTPGSLFSPVFDDERNGDNRGWENVERERKTSRGGRGEDIGRLEGDSSILNEEEDEVEYLNGKTEIHQSSSNLLINLLSAPSRIPLPLSPLLPFSLSTAHLSRNLNPDPFIPQSTRPQYKTDTRNVSAPYFSSTPMLEFGGVLPCTDWMGRPCSTPVSSPDILISLDLIGKASDALQVISLYLYPTQPYLCSYSYLY